MSASLETGFYTPRRVHITPYFHLVANGYALFTAALSEATVCTNKKDCESLCEALEETSADNWEPFWVPPSNPCDICKTKYPDIIREGFDPMNDPQAHLCERCSARTTDESLYNIYHSIEDDIADQNSKPV